jgi:hypothetical protein
MKEVNTLIHVITSSENMWRIEKLNWYHARHMIKLQISLQSHWREKYLSDWSSCLVWHLSFEFKRGICWSKLNLEGQGRQPPTMATNPKPPATSCMSSAASTLEVWFFLTFNLCINGQLSVCYSVWEIIERNTREDNREKH